MIALPELELPPVAWPCRILVAVALLALSACADAPIANVDYNLSYTPGEELYAGNNVPVIVTGNPFPIPQADFVTDAIDAMQGSAFGPDYFVPAVDPNAVYRVVVMFNPSSGVIGDSLCRRPPTAQAIFGVPPAPRAPLAAALCRGDSYLAYAYGSIASGDGPQSETFRSGLRQFLRTLFPAKNPQRTPDRGSCLFGRC
jgi:hypothetical protein